ncbi:MAG: hypothetical protein HQL06_09740 [Nitrospirae bacterium]|nr:hypothetical protein [Nitrospirota bacterium]
MKNWKIATWKINTLMLTPFIAILLALSVHSCGGGGGGGTSSNTTPTATSVSMTIVLRSLNSEYLRSGGVVEKAVPADITAIRISITANDMQSIQRLIQLNGRTEITETFDVPNGKRRLFMVEALNSSGAVLYRGDKLADLNGLAISVDIRMLPVTGPPTSTTGTWELRARCVDQSTDSIDITFPLNETGTGNYSGSAAGKDSNGFDINLTLSGNYNVSNHFLSGSLTVISASYLCVKQYSFGTTMTSNDTGYISTTQANTCGCDTQVRLAQTSSSTTPPPTPTPTPLPTETPTPIPTPTPQPTPTPTPQPTPTPTPQPTPTPTIEPTPTPQPTPTLTPPPPPTPTPTPQPTPTPTPQPTLTPTPQPTPTPTPTPPPPSPTPTPSARPTKVGHTVF